MAGSFCVLLTWWLLCWGNDIAKLAWGPWRVPAMTWLVTAGTEMTWLLDWGMDSTWPDTGGTDITCAAECGTVITWLDDVGRVNSAWLETPTESWITIICWTGMREDAAAAACVTSEPSRVKWWLGSVGWVWEGWESWEEWSSAAMFSADTTRLDIGPTTIVSEETKSGVTSPCRISGVKVVMWGPCGDVNLSEIGCGWKVKEWIYTYVNGLNFTVVLHIRIILEIRVKTC